MEWNPCWYTELSVAEGRTGRPSLDVELVLELYCIIITSTSFLVVKNKHVYGYPSPQNNTRKLKKNTVTTSHCTVDLLGAFMPHHIFIIIIFSLVGPPAVITQETIYILFLQLFLYSFNTLKIFVKRTAQVRWMFSFEMGGASYRCTRTYLLTIQLLDAISNHLDLRLVPHLRLCVPVCTSFSAAGRHFLVLLVLLAVLFNSVSLSLNPFFIIIIHLFYVFFLFCFSFLSRLLIYISFIFLRIRWGLSPPLVRMDGNRIRFEKDEEQTRRSFPHTPIWNYYCTTRIYTHLYIYLLLSLFVDSYHYSIRFDVHVQTLDVCMRCVAVCVSGGGTSAGDKSLLLLLLSLSHFIKRRGVSLLLLLLDSLAANGFPVRQAGKKCLVHAHIHQYLILPVHFIISF
eukprot:gene11864-8152_t